MGAVGRCCGAAAAQAQQPTPFGFYSLTLPAPADSVRLLVSALGYGKLRAAYAGGRSCTHNFRLKPAPAELAGVEVVSSITVDDYNFYLSRRRYADSHGNLFAEPAPLAGNVRNGYGLFGGATDATYRIRL